jgi:hypothetical protein
LGGTAGNELRVVVVQEVFVEGQVLLLGEDGVVGLQAVFVEEGIVTEGLDVCKVVLVDISMRVDAIAQGLCLDIPRRGFSRQRRRYSLVAAILFNGYCWVWVMCRFR